MLIVRTRSNRLSTPGYLVAVCLLFLLSADARAGNETRFTVVDSSPTSWVARGYSDYTVGPDNGWTASAVRRSYDNSISIDFDGTALPGTTVTYWGMDFAAPFDAEITPGFYADFDRWPFQDDDRPGLAFSSSGRLDNSASGFFEVFQVTYGSGSEVLSFSADFTHYGGQDPNDWAIVEVRYNVPEPATAIMLLLGASAGGLTRRARCVR